MSFSQTLTPKIVSLTKEKHFCFTIKQSRIIAQNLESKIFNDSINTTLKTLNQNLIDIIKNRDTSIIFLERKLSLLKDQNTTSEEIIRLKDKALNRVKKQRKRQSFWLKTMGVVSIVLTGIVISN